MPDTDPVAPVPVQQAALVFLTTLADDVVHNDTLKAHVSSVTLEQAKSFLRLRRGYV